jgi:hypothetical protein
MHVDEQAVVLTVASTQTSQTVRLNRDMIAEAKLVVKI